MKAFWCAQNDVIADLEYSLNGRVFATQLRRICGKLTFCVIHLCFGLCESGLFMIWSEFRVESSWKVSAKENCESFTKKWKSVLSMLLTFYISSEFFFDFLFVCVRSNNALSLMKKSFEIVSALDTIWKIEFSRKWIFPIRYLVWYYSVDWIHHFCCVCIEFMLQAQHCYSNYFLANG